MIKHTKEDSVPFDTPDSLLPVTDAGTRPHSYAGFELLRQPTFPLRGRATFPVAVHRHQSTGSYPVIANKPGIHHLHLVSRLPSQSLHSIPLHERPGTRAYQPQPESRSRGPTRPDLPHITRHSRQSFQSLNWLNSTTQLIHYSKLSCSELAAQTPPRCIIQPNSPRHMPYNTSPTWHNRSVINLQIMGTNHDMLFDIVLGLPPKTHQIHLMPHLRQHPPPPSQSLHSTTGHEAPLRSRILTPAVQHRLFQRPRAPTRVLTVPSCHRP